MSPKRRDTLRFEAGKPIPTPAEKRSSARKVEPLHMPPLYDLSEIRDQLETAKGADPATLAAAEYSYDRAIDLLQDIGEEVVAAVRSNQVNLVIMMSGISLRATTLRAIETPKAA